jgi:HlyD family secretion protein
LKKRIVIVAFFFLLLGVGALVYLGQLKVQLRELYYSGTIEATHAELAFQVSGRVADVLADEGDLVERDQVLAGVDQSEYKARHEQAKANLESAMKNLQRAETVLEVNKKTLPDEVARAEAGVKVLMAQLNELEAGYREQDIERARLAFLTAKDIMEEARKNKVRYDNLFQNRIVSEKEWDAVRLKFETALKDFEKAKETLAMLKEGVRKETIQTARARLSEGKAMLKQVRNNLGKIEVAEKEVETLKAQVKSARSAVELAKIYLQYTQLRAPFRGIITTRNKVMTLSDLSTVELKIFVGETEIGKIKPGQRVEVRVDTFPDKVYIGKVSFISPEGEFTPKIIQTHKERVKLVYLVKVSISNPDLELKSGMPADAWLR